MMYLRVAGIFLFGSMICCGGRTGDPPLARSQLALSPGDTQTLTSVWDTSRFAVNNVIRNVTSSRLAMEAQGDNECQAPERFLVGHAIKRLNVAGTLGENRPLDVELWYPARELDDCFDQDTEDAQASEDGPRADDPHRASCTPAVYQSRLRGVPLFMGWDPLGWVTNTSSAFDNAPVAHGRFPVIVFSHGASSNAYEYAYTLEALASYGYIVAAPDHLNNTQDDVRIDFVNTNAKRQVLPCLDGLASPCSRADVSRA